MKSILAGLAACLVTFAVQASVQPYVATGNLVPFGIGFDTYGFMEIWGSDASGAYASPATDAGDPFHFLTAAADTSSRTALQGFATATASFGYDPAAVPLTTSSLNATYDANPLLVQLNAAGASVLLTEESTRLSVSRTTSGHTQTIDLGRPDLTVDGPIAGNAFFYSSATSGSFVADLVSMVGPTAYVSDGFDLSGFSTLPVRLSTPTQFRLVGLDVFMQRSRSTANFGVSPPNPLVLSDWNSFAQLQVFFDGVFDVSVDRSDYGSDGEYRAAADWVAAHIRQVDYEQAVTYDIADIAPVPEPAPMFLMIAGLGAMFYRRARSVDCSRTP